MTVREARTALRGAVVRSLELGPAASTVRVVVVPGLGALGYLLPTLRELARRGVAATLLDLPGFGSSAQRSCAPTLDAITARTVAHLRQRRRNAERVVLMGHSTGAQAALRAAVQVQDEHLVGAVVLAGPTVAPWQRSVPRMVRAAPAAFRRDSLRELVVLQDYLRGRSDLLNLLRTCIADRPEHRVADLRLPLTLTAGRADAFAPDAWLERLRGAAGGSTPALVRVLPGSHNNTFAFPSEVADVLLEAHPEVGMRYRGPVDDLTPAR